MRRLATAALGFSAAIFLANYILPRPALLPLAALLALAGLGLLGLRRKWLLAFEIALFSAAAALLFFRGYEQFTAVPAEKLSGREVYAEGLLLDYPAVYEDYCSVEVMLSGEGFPRMKALLYDGSLGLAGAVPGQRVSCRVSLRAADSRYGEDYDHYYSKGVYLIANSLSELHITEERALLRVLPVYTKRAAADATDRFFPSDTAPFMRSVMLGDKSGLYEDTALHASLSRAGFMHVAAVSGMHLAFLAAFIQLVLGHSRRASLLAVPLLWAFVLITGSSPSAVRAAFMQSLLLAAPILRRENDPITALSTALALVLAINPHAAAGVSLQLSFGAMAGIMCFAGPIKAALSSLVPEGRARRLFALPIGVVAVSLSVMVFTLPLTALHFGYVSVLSPLSNMLALWAVSICFTGGIVCCALGWLVPVLGMAGAWLVSWFARYVFLVASAVSRLSFAVVYLDNPFMWCWFFLSLAAIPAALLIKHGSPLRILYPLALSALILSEALFLSHRYYSSGAGTVAVLDVGQGQSIACISDGAALMVDCGGMGKLSDPGETAGGYLLSRGVRRLDALVLTHLHSDHANGVPMLMELVEVENIYLPTDPQDDEGLLAPITKRAEEMGCKIHFVSEDTRLQYAGTELSLFRPGSRGDANERCLTGTLSLGAFELLFTADASITAENELLEEHDLSGVDAFVVGHHGSRYSTGQALLETLDGDIAIISCGYNNYGHPTNETLDRLSAYGYKIYRTDLNSTVELRPADEQEEDYGEEKPER